VGRLEGEHADPAVTLADEQLHRLAGLGPQGLQRRAGRVHEGQRLRGRTAEGDEPQAQDEAAVPAPTHEPVGLQRDGQAVGGGAAEAGGVDQLGQRAGALLEGVEHHDRLVEHADAA
jgi:hypothetical protein